MSGKSDIEEVIETYKDKIDRIDQNIMMEVVGVRQAVDLLKKALDEIEQNADKRDYHAATKYGECVSNFVFLQRVLGGLQSAVNSKEELIGDIAYKTTGVYEDIAPLVEEKMNSAQPLTEEQKQKNQRDMENFRNSGKSLTEYLKDKKIVK